MERGRYNVGNSQMGKGCITYGASKKRSLPWRDRERERKRDERGREREDGLPLPFPYFVKGDSIILSLFVRDIKVRQGDDDSTKPPPLSSFPCFLLAIP